MKDEYIGALWQKESKNGAMYFSGKVKVGEEEVQIVVFSNKKEKDSQPDWNILKSKPYNKPTEQSHPVEEEVDVSEIPF